MARSENVGVPPSGAVASMRALAREVGRSSSTVRKWTKRRDWPFGAGPFDVGDVLVWMRLHLHRDPAHRFHDAQRGIGAQPLSQIEQARAWNYAESAQIRRLKREQLQGRLHDVQACQARRRRQILAVRNALVRTIPRALGPELVGRARGDIERILRDRLAAVCDAFGGEDDDET